jgi:hypothetical protein
MILDEEIETSVVRAICIFSRSNLSIQYRMLPMQIWQRLSLRVTVRSQIAASSFSAARARLRARTRARLRARRKPQNLVGAEAETARSGRS